LAPDSASSKLLAMGANLSLDGIPTIRIPYIGGAGRPQQPAFIAEGAPIPITNLFVIALDDRRRLCLRCGCGQWKQPP
jgi:hypothetical protein